MRVGPVCFFPTVSLTLSIIAPVSEGIFGECFSGPHLQEWKPAHSECLDLTGVRCHEMWLYGLRTDRARRSALSNVCSSARSAQLCESSLERVCRPPVIPFLHRALQPARSQARRRDRGLGFLPAARTWVCRRRCVTWSEARPRFEPQFPHLQRRLWAVREPIRCAASGLWQRPRNMVSVCTARLCR